MLDSFDEELELEIDDDRLDALTNEFSDHTAKETVDRRIYFKELFRLQGELVKLQSWVQHQKLKVVVIFEGRDSAGKGGVIKRITQRLNPRICQVAALPAPSERERTQWYFQRYVPHLPAGGEIVLFDRSWYNRAGVERVMGFCTEADVEEFFRSVPEFERMLVRSGIILINTGSPSPTKSSSFASPCGSTIPSSSGSSARWMWNCAAAGNNTPRPRKRCWSAPTFRKLPGIWSRPTTRRRHG